MSLFSFGRSSIVLVAITLSLAAPRSAPAAATEGAQRTPRFVVNLLDYVSADYGGAVENGRVKSASEYNEQVEFVNAAVETARELPETRDAQGVQSGLSRLKSLVQSKAAPETVATQAQATKRELIEVAHVSIAPSQWPSLKRGANLFTQNCASCHGAHGHGDGPAGAALKPKPANFADPERRLSSPFKSFNVIREGVPGTAMAAFHQLTDKDVWDLAFFVNSIRFQDRDPMPALDLREADWLEPAASRNDEELLSQLPGSDADKARELAALRLHSGSEDSASALAFARASLHDADRDYQAGKHDSAHDLALKAYLEGIEPVEPRLKATDPTFTGGLESRMAEVRQAIEARSAPSEVSASVTRALGVIDDAEKILAQGSQSNSPWLSFVVAASIILREGFEAVLVLIALLAVIRASGSPRAALWVHAGWAAALALGGIAWVSSGWLMKMSGASREALEGGISIFAVAVLLYMGFWLHSRTEIHRWKQFIDEKVKHALAARNLVGLFVISFFAVFREVFETVLFLRAVWLDGGDSAKNAMALGVVGSIAILFVGSWALIRSSARLPIRKLFSVSSAVMIALSIILAGKGVHAFQETGAIGISAVGSLLDWVRFDLFGIYPTRETMLAQAFVVVVSAILWQIGRKPAVRPSLRNGRVAPST